MNSQEAKIIAEFLFPQIEQEAQITRKVLAAVPQDACQYTPDPKSMTALKLAAHIATVDVWFLESVANGAFAEPEPSIETNLKTPADVLAYFDKNFGPALAKAKEVPAEKLAEVVSFYTFSFPAVVYLNFLIKHSVHHRGQLSAYLRPMGAKVPSIYGGSADEPMEAAAQA
ncbi:MAG TPA: DinB family protein [Bryobacteraceae bacterium]|nr:DinB family protein [Bryobacteraceae bacterium]